MKTCRAPFELGNACSVCDRCIANAKAFVTKHKRSPVNRLTEQNVKVLNFSCSILQNKMGLPAFQKFLKEGK